LTVRYPIIDETPIIMHTEMNTVPARLISIVSFESEDSIKAGVAR